MRRPSLIDFIHGRLGRLEDALGDKSYFVGNFTVADIAMATVLRGGEEAAVFDEHPRLAAYQKRCLSRPAYQRALTAQLDSFSEEAGPPAG